MRRFAFCDTVVRNSAGNEEAEASEMRPRHTVRIAGTTSTASLPGVGTSSVLGSSLGGNTTFVEGVGT